MNVSGFFRAIVNLHTLEACRSRKTEVPNEDNCSYFVIILQLLPQLHQRGALATFVLRSFFDSGHVGVRFEKFANAAAKNSGAVAVNDAHARQPGEKSVVEIFLELVGRFIHSASDEIDLRAQIVGVRARDRYVHAFLLSGGGERIRLPLPRISSKT